MQQGVPSTTKISLTLGSGPIKDIPSSFLKAFQGKKKGKTQISPILSNSLGGGIKSENGNFEFEASLQTSGFNSSACLNSGIPNGKKSV